MKLKKNLLILSFILIISINSVGFISIAEKTVEKGQIIVLYKDEIKTNLQSENPKIKDKKRLNTKTELIHIENDKDVEGVLNEYKQNKNVLAVDYNVKRRLNFTPNDTYFANQWWLTKLRAQEAWSAMPYALKPVVVAVIDGGVDINHPDLANKIIQGGRDFYANTEDVSDYANHGTAVAGIIAANTDNAVGIAGLSGNFNVKILPLKVVSPDLYISLSDEIEAIEYAIAMGVDVINLSLGDISPYETEKVAINRALQAGISVVASAGNNYSSGYYYPASYDGVISVGATNSSDLKTPYSNYNDKVDVVAPGDNIYSCNPANSYGAHYGTSFSAPMVSAIVAMVKSLKPEFTPLQMEALIQGSAVDLGAVGRDNNYGYGRADALNAVKAALQLPVTGIYLNKASTLLISGEGEELGYSIYPYLAKNTSVTWSSSNSGIAYVDQTGYVFAGLSGTAVITATTVEGAKISSCNVRVLSDNSLKDGLKLSAPFIKNMLGEPLQSLPINSNFQLCSIVNNQTGSYKNICLVYGLYKTNGKLINLITANITINPLSRREIKQQITAGPDSYIKLLIWEGLSGAMPIAYAARINQ